MQPFVFEAIAFVQPDGAGVRAEDLERDAREPGLARPLDGRVHQPAADPLTTKLRRDAHAEPAGVPKSFPRVGKDVAPADDARVGGGGVLRHAACARAVDEQARALPRRRLDERQIPPLAADVGEAVVKAVEILGRAAANLNDEWSDHRVARSRASSSWKSCGSGASNVISRPSTGCRNARR